MSTKNGSLPAMGRAGTMRVTCDGVPTEWMIPAASATGIPEGTRQLEGAELSLVSMGQVALDRTERKILRAREDGLLGKTGSILK